MGCKTPKHACIFQNVISSYTRPHAVGEKQCLIHYPLLFLRTAQFVNEKMEQLMSSGHNVQQSCHTIPQIGHPNVDFGSCLSGRSDTLFRVALVSDVSHQHVSPTPPTNIFPWQFIAAETGGCWDHFPRCGVQSWSTLCYECHAYNWDIVSVSKL